MQFTKSVLGFLLITLFIFSCGKNDDPTPDPDPDPMKDCQLTQVWSKSGSNNTAIGQLGVEYDADGRISAAGQQEYDFTYNAAGNVTNAKLEATTWNPQVEYVFTYNGNQISTVAENWGTGSTLEERFTYAFTYGSDSRVSIVEKTGFINETLTYDWDNNGNPITWSSTQFGEVYSYTFGTEKGLVEGLTHNQAFAYSLVTNVPFLLFNNSVLTEVVTDNGVEQSNSTFNDREFNDEGFQIKAYDSANVQYDFEYNCF